MALSVYLIAGEASGDALGAGLMHALKEKLGAAVVFYGIGGEKMAAEGLQSLFPYHELSLMGFAEIVPHLSHLMSRIQQTTEHITVKNPDVLVTIDSPGFNFRVVKQLRKHGKLRATRLVHYVAPSVWAYKPQRAKKCAELFDHMLCLLPFEPEYFEKEGLKATFVGHPAAFMEKGDGESFRLRHNISPAAPLICLMPGSRKNEIKRHINTFARSVAMLARAWPNVAIAVPVSERLMPEVAAVFANCPYRAVLMADEAEKRHAIAASTVALVKSGTVSLEVAAGGCPQVVTYRTSVLTAAIIRRMIRVKYANLINLILQREVIPELLQERSEPLYLANAVEALLCYPDLRQTQKSYFLQAFEQLRAPEGRLPAQIAAEIVLAGTSS